MHAWAYRRNNDSHIARRYPSQQFAELHRYTVSSDLRRKVNGETQAALIEQARLRKASLQDELDKTRHLQVDERDMLHSKVASLRINIARGRYKAGIGSITELLNAQNALADAREQRVIAVSKWRTDRLGSEPGKIEFVVGVRTFPNSYRERLPPACFSTAAGCTGAAAGLPMRARTAFGGRADASR